MTNVMLGDVASFVRGVTFKPSEVVDQGIGVMRTKNVQELLQLNDIVRIPRSLVKRDQQFLREGDTLISSANSWNIVGKGCWVPRLPEPLAIGGFVTALRPEPSLVDPRFLYRWYTTPATQAKLRSFSNRTTSISNLNLARAGQMRLPLPSLEEQRRIAAILDRADAIRSKRRRVLTQLDLLAQELFHDIFNNSDWPTAPLGRVASTRLGKMLDKKKQSGGITYPYLRNANVQWFAIDVDDLLEMEFSDAECMEFSLRKGDVLVCEGGQPGRAAVWQGSERNIFFQKALHRVRVGDGLTPEYLVHFLWSAVHGGALKEFVTSATIAHLTGEKLRTVPVPIPPIALQRRFGEQIAAVRRHYEIAKRELAADDELFASLQSRAFRGEL